MPSEAGIAEPVHHPAVAGVEARYRALDDLRAECAGAESWWLSEPELERYESFGSESRRESFFLGRAFAKQLLVDVDASLSMHPPAAIEICSHDDRNRGYRPSVRLVGCGTEFNDNETPTPAPSPPNCSREQRSTLSCFDASNLGERVGVRGPAEQEHALVSEHFDPITEQSQTPWFDRREDPLTPTLSPGSLAMKTSANGTSPAPTIRGRGGRSGRSFAMRRGNAERNDEILPIALSLSHTSRGIYVAATADANACLGVDLTDIHPRPRSFINAWFTEAERRLCEHADPTTVATIWAIKEAAYKAVNRGETFAPKRFEVKAGGNQYTVICHDHPNCKLQLAVHTIDNQIAVLASSTRDSGPRTKDQ